MKFNIKKTLLAVAMPLLLSACFDLDQYPKDSLPNDASFKSMADARFWMNGCYESLRSSTQGVYMTTPELQTDLIDIRLGNLGGNVYTWEEFTTSEFSTANIWNKYYQNLANVNNCLENFDQIAATTSQDKAKISTNKGELHLLRALYYSRLAVLFCKPYNATTAQTDLGLPLLKGLWVKDSDLPARSTLEETYSFILSDIAQAEELLKDNTNALGSKVLTPDAALMLKARVLLYKGDWANAYTTANQLVESALYPLAQSEDALRNMWTQDATTETLVQLPMTQLERLDDNARNVAYTNEYASRNNSSGVVTRTFGPAYLPNQWVLDLYESTDLRKEIYYTQKEIRKGQLRDKKNLYIVYKFPGNPNLRLATSLANKAEHQPKIFRIAEAYLIAAEAAYMNGDVAKATEVLNKLRTARKATATTKTGAELLSEIKLERVRELAYEGYRLADLKRWGEGVDRTQRPPQDADYIRNTPAEQYNGLKKEANDYKMVWPIPGEEITRLRGKFVQNPGW